MNGEERWNKIKVLAKTQSPHRKRKYISRNDRPEKKEHCWIVRIQVNGKQVSKYFSDKRMGGKSSALLAAVAFRNKIIKENDIVFMEGVRNPPFVKGKGGVHFGWKSTRGIKHAVFVACWSEPVNGKQVRKTNTFSVNRYGYYLAKKKAEKCRREKLKELYG